MEFNNSQPIYMQIIDEYKKRIIRGELQKGDKIPSQREYAQQVRVNPNTVQRAYREMESLNMVETLRGQGTFIAAGEEMKAQMAQNLADQVMRHFISGMCSLGYRHVEIMEMLQCELERSEEVEKVDRV